MMDEQAAVAVLREAGVLAAWVFGSHAAGTARPDSDIDVALLTEEPMPLLRRERLARELEGPLGAPVDLVEGLDDIDGFAAAVAAQLAG